MCHLVWENALEKPGKTAPGKDEVCYRMMKQIRKEGKKKLLMLYNKVWEEGKVPNSWKKALFQ